MVSVFTAIQQNTANLTSVAYEIHWKGYQNAYDHSLIHDRLFLLSVDSLVGSNWINFLFYHQILKDTCCVEFWRVTLRILRRG